MQSLRVYLNPSTSQMEMQYCGISYALTDCQIMACSEIPLSSIIAQEGYFGDQNGQVALIIIFETIIFLHKSTLSRTIHHHTYGRKTTPLKIKVIYFYLVQAVEC